MGILKTHGVSHSDALRRTEEISGSAHDSKVTSKLPSRIKVFFSGFCNPNPSYRIGYCAIILSSTGKIIYQIDKQIERNFPLTNFAAEFAAVVASQQYLIKSERTSIPVCFFGSCELVIKQINGKSSINFDLPYGHFAKLAVGLKEKFANITFDWICKQQNPAKQLNGRSIKEARI